MDNYIKIDDVIYLTTPSNVKFDIDDFKLVIIKSKNPDDVFKIRSNKAVALWCFGNTKVAAFGNTKVAAFGNTKVAAFDETQITAFDKSEIFAYHDATVIASKGVVVYNNNNNKVLRV